MLTLAWLFLRVGAVAFGGLGATLAVLEQTLVRRRALLPAATIADPLTYTKLLPGSTVVQVVAYLVSPGGYTSPYPIRHVDRLANRVLPRRV